VGCEVVDRCGKSRNLLPFLDMAYQGFGDGIDEDAFAARELASSPA
jgi:aromatic-amino-acid transaminase